MSRSGTAAVSAFGKGGPNFGGGTEGNSGPPQPLESLSSPGLAMASPDGLRLYFGNRLPPDVADIIFEFGFHLWLAKPHDAWKLVRMDYPERRSGWRSGTLCAFRTTIKMVNFWDLSYAARKLVGHRDYENRTLGDLIVGWPQRPVVWPPYARWLRDGDEWYVEHDCDPRVWAAWRSPPLEAQPPLPGFDDVDDDDL